MHKRSFQLKVMAIVAIVNLLFYIEVPFYGYIVIKVTKNAANMTTTSYVCNLKSLYFYNWFYIVDLVQAFFVPFAIMITSSLMIIRGLYKTRRRIEAHENREMKSRKVKDTKFALSSIVLDFLFVLLTTPIGLTYIINISDKALSAFIIYLTALLFSCNFSKSFFAYLFSNSIFRREFIGLIKSINPHHISVHSFSNFQRNSSRRFTLK